MTAAPAELRSVAQRLLDSAEILSLDPVVEVDWETPLDKCLPRHQPGVVDAVRHGLLGRDDRGAAQGADPPGGGVGRQHRHLVRDDPAADDPARHVRQGPHARRVPVGAHRDRRRVPALDHVRQRRREARGPDVPPAAVRPRARPALQDPRLRRDGVRRDPGRRGGPRRHAARLDARRARRPRSCARSTTSTSSRSRGTWRSPARRRASGSRSPGLSVGRSVGLVVADRRPSRSSRACGTRTSTRTPGSTRSAPAARRSRNENFHSMLRSSCSGLMEFLSSAGLLTGPAKLVYRAAHLY